MPEQQLWLFQQPKLLRERLGDAFFRSVPARPGVYLMTDRLGRVLYVGQSGNLRHRLNTYKNIRAENGSLKLVRLAQAVETIAWEECESSPTARLRENQLLRFHRPKFNTVNTRPEAYGFIGLRVSEQRLEIWLTQVQESDGDLYGAFKGLRWQGYGALVRLLVQYLNESRSSDEFPPRLLSARPPRRLKFNIAAGSCRVKSGGLAEKLRGYLNGESNELVDCLRRDLPKAEALPPFWRNLQALDLEIAEEFFQRGPRRNRQLHQEHGLRSRVIAPPLLDDLLALSSSPVTSSPNIDQPEP